MADVKAGGTTWTTQSTIIVGETRPGFSGDVVFQAGNHRVENEDRLLHDADGVRGLGNFKGNGVVGWGGDQGGNGVFGGGGQGRSGVRGGNGVVGFGQAAGGGDGVGVFGVSGGVAAGVVGTCAAAQSQAGVFGYNSAERGVAFGVLGICDAASGSGVAAESAQGVGVKAHSGGNHGVVGLSDARKYSGVFGYNSQAGEGVLGYAERTGDGVRGYSAGEGRGVFGESAHGVAIVGVTHKEGGFAGLFGGRVSVIGDFAVFGSKSAAVPHPDGAHRLLYSVESPESWFEDFGEARLQRGRATVRLPQDFLPLIRTSAYHVFLTPYGECAGLYVAQRSPTEFHVAELGGGKSSIRFAYRIVGKRKDVAGKRLEKVQLPQIETRARTEKGDIRPAGNEALRRLAMPTHASRPVGARGARGQNRTGKQRKALSSKLVTRRKAGARAA